MSVTMQIIGVVALAVAVVVMALLFQRVDHRIAAGEPETEGRDGAK